MKLDEFVKSRKAPVVGIPANAGVTGLETFYGCIKLDKLVKSWKAPVVVIPAKAEIQETQPLMDSRFRGNDGLGDFLRDHQT